MGRREKLLYYCHKKCQNKTLRIINFKDIRELSEPIFKKVKVLTLENNISFETTSSLLLIH